MIDDIFDIVEDDSGDESDGTDAAPSSSEDDLEWFIDSTLQVTEIAQSVHGLQTGGFSSAELMRFLAMVDNAYLTESESRSATIETYYVDRILDIFM